MLGITLGHPNYVIRVLRKECPDFTVKIGAVEFSGDRISCKEIPLSVGTEDQETMYEHRLDLSDKEAMEACRVGELTVWADGQMVDERPTPVQLFWGGDVISKPPVDDSGAKAAEHAAEQRKFDLLRPSLLGEPNG